MLAAESATKKPLFVIVCLLLQFILAACVMVWLAGISALITLSAILLSFLYYYAMSRKHFGGITGDLAGFFVCLAELSGLITLFYGA